MTDTIKHIIACEQALAKAHLTLDIEILDSLFHPDYMILQPDGNLERKADVLQSYQSGEGHWDKAELDDLEVTVLGDFARAIGKWSATGVNRGQAFDYQARFISIWIKTEECWRNISYQSVEI